MAHQPNNPTPFLPNRPRSPRDLASLVIEYVRALIRIVCGLLLATAALASAYIEIRAILVGIRVCTAALGI